MRCRLLVVPWAICAVLAMAGPQTAQGDSSSEQLQADSGKKKKKKKSQSTQRCVDYSQDANDSGMILKVANGCDWFVSCTIRWKLSCGDDTTDTPERNYGETGVLDSDESLAADADASLCGDEAWEITRVRWSCEPVE